MTGSIKRVSFEDKRSDGRDAASPPPPPSEEEEAEEKTAIGLTKKLSDFDLFSNLGPPTTTRTHHRRLSVGDVEDDIVSSDIATPLPTTSPMERKLKRLGSHSMRNIGSGGGGISRTKSGPAAGLRAPLTVGARHGNLVGGKGRPHPTHTRSSFALHFRGGDLNWGGVVVLTHVHLHARVGSLYTFQTLDG